MSSTSAPAAQRQYYLDWLRIGAIGLLVLYHVGMYYVSWGWHIKSVHASGALEPWMRLLSPWRMDLLFIVSGAATSFMLLRQGPSIGLLRGRAARLLLPLLFGMLVVVPPQSYLEVVHRGYAGGFIDFMQLYLTGYGGFCDAARNCLVLPTWNHLWFLPYLFAYTALLWCLLRWRPRLLQRTAARAEPLLRGWRLIVWPVLFLVATRLALRDRFPVTHALVDDWFMHAQYAAMFLFGAVLARTGSLPARMAALRLPALATALAAWLVLVVVPMAPTAALVRPLVFSVLQWCAIVAAIGFAYRHLNVDAGPRRYLTDAVFPVYILHQTVTIVAAHALAADRLPPLIEGPLLVLVTLAVSLACYELVRRVPVLRPWFGLRRSAAAAAPAQAQGVLREPAAAGESAPGR